MVPGWGSAPLSHLPRDPAVQLAGVPDSAATRLITWAIDA
jgi:hypothetical protein